MLNVTFPIFILNLAHFNFVMVSIICESLFTRSTRWNVIFFFFSIKLDIRRTIVLALDTNHIAKPLSDSAGRFRGILQMILIGLILLESILRVILIEFMHMVVVVVISKQVTKI